jgi:hypothetical protein
MKLDFFIIGNGGSGTSLMRGLLNAHSRIDCAFELWGTNAIEDQLDYWVTKAAEHKDIWGDKLPLEQFWSRKWQHKDIKKLINHFQIIWIVRRFGKWKKQQALDVAEKNWRKSRALYWSMRNHAPTKIIEVSFEDLLLRPEVELKRVCAFLKIRFERKMLNDGLKDTGHRMFNYGEIKTAKI